MAKQINDPKDKLRVLAIVPTAFCFGLQHITLDFFGLLNTEIEAHFLVSAWNDGEFIRELKRRDIPYSFSWLGMFSRHLDWVNLKMSLHSLIKMPKLYFDVFRLSRRFKPDLLYFANHHELILLTPVLKLIKKPVICHMHDPAPAIPFQKKSFQFYGKKVDRFIAISQDVMNRTVLLGARPDKITVIHNGIKLNGEPTHVRGNKFAQQFGWPANAYIVGITGQMTATKGHEDVIRAAVSAGKTLYLVIGGKRIEPYYSELVHLISELGLTERVGFSGWQENVNDFFGNIDLFVLASRHDEGYGLVVAEAMALGKPVITTASGGAIELVEEGITGFIVPKNNVTEMADKIKWMALHPEANSEMGRQGRKRVEELFAIQKQVILIRDVMQDTAGYHSK